MSGKIKCAIEALPISSLGGIREVAKRPSGGDIQVADQRAVKAFGRRFISQVLISCGIPLLFSIKNPSYLLVDEI